MPQIGGYWTGAPPKITIELAERVGDRVGEGMTIDVALDLETPQIPLDHWNKSLNNSSRIAGAYRRKRALGIQAKVHAIASAPKLPVGLCWLLERALGYTGKGGTHVNVQVNTCIGLSDDIAKRARAFVGSNEVANQRRRLKGE